MTLGRQSGYILTQWVCGHIENAETAGWKKCPSCMQKRIKELEAKIDAVMLEYCPDEMTAEQIENWSENQGLADDSG